MSQSLLIIIAVVVVAIVVAAAFLISGRRRSEHLRSRFGSEYERAVAENGDRAKAEAELLKREKRVEKLDIHPLDPDARRNFMERWKEVQARFVDDPPRAVMYADALLAEVMSARGYPVNDFEQRAGDISVDHPDVVQHYRVAHEIAVRHSRNEAGTEDLRQAMVHYRALFDDLVGAVSPGRPQEEFAH